MFCRKAFQRGIESMKKLTAWTMTMMLVPILGLTACGGGGATVQTEHSAYGTTLGQELKDLDDSYKKGIITQSQYEDAKTKLIEQRTK